MTVYEAIAANAELLTALAHADVTVEDVKNLPLYQDFCAMQSDGHKTIYIVASLCDKYVVSERQVWRIVKKFKKFKRKLSVY
jgi:hypothetical protein